MSSADRWDRYLEAADHPPEATVATEYARPLVERPALAKRTALSKSLLTAYELCQTKTWFGIHDPRPFVPNEKMTFGSAVDAGVEVIIKTVASGQPVDIGRAYAAAAYIPERDKVEIVFSGVERAIDSFIDDVLPACDWTRAVTQASITAEIPGLGTCNGHPDIIMGDGSVFDVKTSARAKPVPSLELGFYALLLEADGRTVPTVGYLDYVRLKKPYWHGYTKGPQGRMGAPLVTPVTDELRTWAMAKASAYVRARKADVTMNPPESFPENYSMTGGPRFDSMCLDCPYNPALGGPCLIAVKGADDE